MARSVTAIQSDLDAFYALRTQAATNGGIAEYQIDSGQGRQSVKRITLGEINSTIKILNEELLDASGDSASLIIGLSR